MFRKIKRLFRKKQPTVAVDRRTELRNSYPDFQESTIEVILGVEPFTMTSPERIEALCGAVEYVSTNQIPGDVVECGVWRGGSMMAIASCLQANQDTDRRLHLYDTFEGMPPAQDVDKDFLDTPAANQLDEQDRADPRSVWCYSGIQEVRQNMSRTGYPEEQLQFVKGKVEDTLEGEVPERIALLRLDTDWYESTKICLEVLFPRLVAGGVLIIDDYGHWQGCRQAVDEYFSKTATPIFLQRIDYTGRIAIKSELTCSHPQKLSA